MKALADLLEVIGENGLIISNPEPQTSDSLLLMSTEDCFPNAQLCAFPVAIRLNTSVGEGINIYIFFLNLGHYRFCFSVNFHYVEF